ncbi:MULTISPECIES: ribonuclease HIII [Leuconostoc]|uniref:Ribonuclease HIII n=2 Tax=Leuconostoc kimchii TaxID=136609 RepID=D5T2W2_LEUKI|nr:MULTISPECIES: ribonuclease HIII [Leuconostoc]ADG40611.1 ribonuclease HIII [Leuconostoc kimchii IMSNU 11154]AEJ31407.1 ribonuclease HIII [Leuconostoc sp. C2]QBR47071.1 ribonuclease HIII [Leuconostoc kimchii]
MQTVIQVTPKILQKMANYYAKNQTLSLPAGAIFSAKNSRTTITGYRSGKVMFQGPGFSQEAALWQPAKPKTIQSVNKTITRPGNHLPEDFSNWSVLGSDEVGAGAYFGPLTTAAVFVSQRDLKWVRQLGIADSKTLTDDKMRQIAPEIIARLPHHVVNLMPEKYNQLQPTNNVNQLKAISHNFVLGKVLEKIDPTRPDGILIDQFAQESTYFNYLQRAKQQHIIRQNVYFTTKGEQYHLSVAAASILARVVELDSMASLSQEAGIVLPIGAGREVDQVAAQLLKQGKSLRHYAKLHFANTQKATNLL